LYAKFVCLFFVVWLREKVKVGNRHINHFIRLIHIIKKNVVFCISVTGVLILHLFFAWQPLNRLEGFRLLTSNGPLMDDSYIFFKISRDLADWLSGAIPSLQLTSGFQPLIAFLYFPFFQLFWYQKEFPIHLALSLNALLGFFAHILLYCLLRKIVNRSIATFLVSIWIWSPYVMYQSINGMETTLALLLLLITLHYYWRINHLSHHQFRSWFVLGLLLGIGFWARVDLGMLGVAIVIDQTWLAIQGDRYSRSLRLKDILLCSLTALVVASPWMIFIIINTGNLLPISGRAVRQVTNVVFNHLYLNHSGFSLMMLARFKRELLIYQPLIALSKHISWQLCISGLSLLGLILAVRDRQLRILFRPILIFQFLILASYIIIIGGAWHLNRYLYPVYTLMLFLHASTLRYLELRIKLRPLIVAIMLFILCIPYAFSYTAQYHFQWSQNLPARYLSAALFAKDRIPPKAKVGTFQSGCLSYWLDNQVINLDGVLNKEAYFHLQNKTMDVYLDEQKIDYLVEEVFLFRMWDNYLGGQLSKHYSMVASKTEKLLRRGWNKLGIYKRKP